MDLNNFQKVIYYTVAFYSVALIILLVINSGLFPNFTDQITPYWQASIINIISAGSTMTLGAVSLFLAQKHFSEKRKEEISEDIASPLLLEIDDIKKKFLEDFTQSIDVNFDGYSSIWKSFKNTHKQVIASDITSKIPQFYNDCNEYCNGLHKIQIDALPVIYSEFNKMLGEISEFKTVEDRQDLFKIQFYDKYGVEKDIHLFKSLIFNINIIEYLKSIYDDFEEEKIKLYVLDFRFADKSIDFNIDKYMDFSKIVESYLIKRDPINRIREERKKLIAISEEIKTIIKPHIQSINDLKLK